MLGLHNTLHILAIPFEKVHDYLLSRFLTRSQVFIGCSIHLLYFDLFN